MKKLNLSKIVKKQIKCPSPIRQIMKVAERENIIKMGINPEDVISFSGGWVNHRAPKEFREEYIEMSVDDRLFHITGAYTATLGDNECREQIAEFEKHLFGMKNIHRENIMIGMGSTQLTHDLLKTILDPGDKVMVVDPTYANYFGQIEFSVADIKIISLPVLDSQKWEYLPVHRPEAVIDSFDMLFRKHKPKLFLFCSPDNPTGQIMPQEIVDFMYNSISRNRSYLAIDFAYKCQCFEEPPKYFSWSPQDYPNLIGIHSNSKWARALGRRLGWIEASEEVIGGIERVQQCSILCADSLHQMTMAQYLKKAIPSGSFLAYINEMTNQYRRIAKRTIDAVDRELGFPRLEPMGGLYTVLDVGMDGNEFTSRALTNTSVLFVPGGGFGGSLKNSVRISYGPLVTTPEKIDEGLARVGNWLKKAGK